MKRFDKKVLKKGVASICVSFLIVLCIYFVYDYVAVFLNRAIETHSIGFLEGFDLKTKLQEKCGFEGVPSAAQVQETFGLFYKLFLFWTAFVGLLIFAPWTCWKKSEKGKFFPTYNPKKKYIRGSLFSISALFISVVALFLFWNFVIRISGLLGDDYYCGMTQWKSFITRFSWWVWCYATHVSRIGESIYYIFPQTIDRTYHLIVTPLFVAVFPFVMKLFANASFSMTEWRGVAYYWMMGLLSFMGVVIIRIFIVLAPTANYFYPVVLCLFFWSFYYRYSGYKQNSDYSTLSKILFFILGVISGWSTEGLGAIGVFLGGIWLFYWWRKENHIGKMHYIGLIGYLSGACNVMFSTGPVIRGLHDTSLTGGNVPYNLTVLPLWQRFTYVPEMFEAIWPCVRLTVMFLALIIVLALIFKQKECLTRQMIIKLFYFIVVALALCFVYIVGAIPNGSTFTPASFVMIAALGIVYAKLLETNWKIAVFPLIALVVTTFVYMSPRIKHAMVTSKAEKARIVRILEAKQQGITDLVLSYPANCDLSVTEKGKIVDRTYIPFQHFSPNPVANKHQAAFFGLHSIAEENWKP